MSIRFEARFRADGSRIVESVLERVHCEVAQAYYLAHVSQDKEALYELVETAKTASDVADAFIQGYFKEPV